MSFRVLEQLYTTISNAMILLVLRSFFFKEEFSFYYPSLGKKSFLFFFSRRSSRLLFQWRSFLFSSVAKKVSVLILSLIFSSEKGSLAYFFKEDFSSFLSFPRFAFFLKLFVVFRSVRSLISDETA